MEEKIKLCKDCKYVVLKLSLTDIDRCKYLRNVGFFSEDKRLNLCPVVRNVPSCTHYCGPEARNFVQNTSLWYKLKNYLNKWNKD